MYDSGLYPSFIGLPSRFLTGAPNKKSRPKPAFRGVFVATLLIAELRSTFFQKRRHAFFLIFSGKHRMEHATLEQ